MFSGSGDTEHFFSEEIFEDEDGLDVFSSVASLPSGGADGVEEPFELFLPVAEGVDFYASDFAGEADADSFIGFAAVGSAHVGVFAPLGQAQLVGLSSSRRGSWFLLPRR